MAGLFDIFSNKNAQDAANYQTAGLNGGYNQLSGLFGSGRDAATNTFDRTSQPIFQNWQNAQAGVKQYGNALGLGGAEGNASAIAGFQNNPGYQFQLQQGSENLMRNKAATGQLNSGGTNIDLQNLGQGMANQGWQQYLQNLQPYMGASGQAAGQYGALGGQLGTNLMNSYNTQGNAAYGTQTGIGNAQANASLANNNASANMWGALGAGAKLGTSLFGAFGGGTGWGK